MEKHFAKPLEEVLTRISPEQEALEELVASETQKKHARVEGPSRTTHSWKKSNPVTQALFMPTYIKTVSNSIFIAKPSKGESNPEAAAPLQEPKRIKVTAKRNWPKVFCL